MSNLEQTPQLNIADVSGSFYWETDYFHNDNAFTMQDFIENHLPPEFEVILDDGSYTEVLDGKGQKWALHASGDGDFVSHRIRFEALS